MALSSASYQHAFAISLNWAQEDCTYPFSGQLRAQMWQVKHLSLYFRVSPLYKKKKKKVITNSAVA